MVHCMVLVVCLALSLVLDVGEMKYTVGVVGKEWYNIFRRKIIDRREDSLVILREIEINSTTYFYQSILDNFQLLSTEKIHVLVGGTSLAMAQTAAHLNIPYFATDTNVHPSNLFEYENMPNFYSVLITDEVYSRAIIDLINLFEVSKVSVIIDSSVNYKHFVKPIFDQRNISILMWTLTKDDTIDITRLIAKIDKILEDSRDAGCWDFVVKGDTFVVKQIITRAKYYGMLVRPNKWYLPSFVCRDISIPAIRQIYSNITMINEQCSESYLRRDANYTFEAVVNKVIQLFRMVDWKLTPDTFSQRYKSGEKRIFDKMGIQSKSELVLHTLNVEDDQNTDDLRFAGAWLYKDGNSQLSYLYRKDPLIPIKQQIHLRVAAVEEHPHLIRQPNGSVIGFGVDLISELCSLMDATFTITLKNSMGMKVGSNWTGVVGELLMNNADITLGPLVESVEMEQVIDFSASYKQREISLVMTGPSPSMSLFQFVQPFSWDVWLLCLVSTIFVTFLTWGIEIVHDHYFDESEIKFNFKESSWFAFGNVLKKQLDVFPNNVPALINNASIFFFSLIIVTMYTANLAAFLTVQAYPNIIKEVEDLNRLPPKSKITFGAVKDSPILEFFRESDLDTFKEMYETMAVKNPHWLVNSTAEGYRRALREPYVFISDDSVNQYEVFTEREYDCKLIIVGRPFGKRSFAIGMQQNSRFSENINRHLLDLLETGKVDSLIDKWWKASSICAGMDAPNMNISPLALENVAGVFLIVVVGIFVAVVWFAAQLIIYLKCKNEKRRNKPGADDNDEANNEVLILPNNHGTSEPK